MKWTMLFDVKMFTTMFVFLLLVSLGASAAQKLEVEPSCPTCVIINNGCFNATAVLQLTAPFRKDVVINKMGILRSRNTLYYAFEPNIEDIEYYKIAFVNLDNSTQTGVISSPELVLNFGTFDIDQDNEVIYMGGSDGVFFLDTTVYKLAPYSSRGDMITSVFFKTNVNFAKYEEKGITVKKGDFFKTLLEDTLVTNFVITKYDVIVYQNNLGLFVAKGDAKVRVSHYPFFRGLAVDLDGNVYTWLFDAIYTVAIEKSIEESKLVRMATLPVFIGSMVFDNDNNLMFTVKNELFRLTPTETGCKVKVEAVRA